MRPAETVIAVDAAFAGSVGDDPARAPNSRRSCGEDSDAEAGEGDKTGRDQGERFHFGTGLPARCD
jgi:hypothetical protein